MPDIIRGSGMARRVIPLSYLPGAQDLEYDAGAGGGRHTPVPVFRAPFTQEEEV